MRDIIWTIIVVWVVWKLIDALRAISASKTTNGSTVNNSRYNDSYNSTGSQSSQEKPKKGELKSDAGEYVDFEEVK